MGSDRVKLKGWNGMMEHGDRKTSRRYALCSCQRWIQSCLLADPQVALQPELFTLRLHRLILTLSRPGSFRQCPSYFASPASHSDFDTVQTTLLAQ